MSAKKTFAVCAGRGVVVAGFGIVRLITASPVPIRGENRQAFGMIVTGAPYAAVRPPSDVVTLENRIRPDTVGKLQPIQPKSELMPRGCYTWQVPEQG